ncbi:hypothetical protein K443DRAFT_116578 [Laccaria amethystina LaAM-08-1]|uniref:CxC6 like cysteine cluster associated with KDZ domain-containing protein n=1 Tax=Laccaria amethystina LaAM-08-1 TaxID=1095629 RepID=A0A0C9WLN8_9AGAR|nr:hypothetical protein K443DRAFT_116578 [Laccaria amethystina LaAM-08-1]
MYNFHASASAYAEFWNNTYGIATIFISRAQVWQAFVQESICTIAGESQFDLELGDGLNIKDVTTEAFQNLGENGIIRAADKHSCSECTHVFKRSGGTSSKFIDASSEENKYVKMVVLDGIVMGPTHCAFDNCLNDLSNSRGGSLCDQHHVSLASYCLVRNCDNRRVDGTSACQDHQREWNTFRKFSQHNIRSGIHQMLQRPAESYAWQPTSRGPNTQRHDDPASDPPLPPNYFTPSRYYCVETICAPCGVIIAWTKFARSESTTNILNFLGSVYPDEESRPDYICIDKACQVLATAVTNGSWETWKRTSRFIVDSYHYNNHRVQDYLC